MTKKIIDEFTDLPVSANRKWVLRNPKKANAAARRYYQRNPERAKAITKKYHQTEKYREWVRSDKVKAKKSASNRKWRLENYEYDLERKRQDRIKKKLAKAITNHE